MSGHSKWANIKRKKEANDKVKSNIFAKRSRLITLSVVEGGGITDPNLNVRLRLAIEKAKEDNMPKDNIQRAIEKGIGPGKTELKEILYEGFAPYGVALLITAATDNSNRTFSEIRNVLDRHNGKVGGQGSVAYLFKKTGMVTLNKSENTEEDIFVFAENIQAKDFEQYEQSFILYFPYEQLGKVKDQLGQLKAATPEIVYRPLSSVELTGIEEEQKLINLMEDLENLDDVQNVYTNAVFASD